MHHAQKAVVATRGKRDAFKATCIDEAEPSEILAQRTRGFHGVSRGLRPGQSGDLLATARARKQLAAISQTWSYLPLGIWGEVEAAVRILPGAEWRAAGGARERPPPTFFPLSPADPSRSGLVREGRGPRSTDHKQLATMPLEGMRRSSQTRPTQVDGRHGSLGRFVWAEPGGTCTTPLLGSKNGWRGKAGRCSGTSQPALHKTRDGLGVRPPATSGCG